ncbi:MAG: transforming growth factor-beta-induced protein [Planctomycetota bacterium]|jgi:transforming growth factor-beta-induced protein
MLLTTALCTSLLFAGPVDDTCSADSAVASAQAEKSIVETALGNESFSTLVAALGAAELVETLQGEGPFTVFAPTNAAFAKLPKEQLANLLKPENKALLQAILTYHVVSGNLPAKKVVTAKNAATVNGQRIDIKVTDAGVTVDGASVITTDIACSNGVIHVIDSVILPSTLDLVETAVEAGSFKTLAAALGAAQLVEALQGKGPFTVFAPTDEAFAALPEGTVANLLKPENRGTLAAILTLHVVPGRIYSETVAAGSEFKTLQGQTLLSRMHDGKVLVNGAQILKADIEATNGVIHVIDTVLLPE